MKSGMLAYGSQSIDYSIVTSNTLEKRVRIHVYPNGLVEVETPQSSTAYEVRQAVRKRARWIVNQLQVGENARSHVLPREYISGETHFYLGRRYQLKICETAIERETVKLVGGRILVTLKNSDRAAVKRRLRDWYRGRANDYFSRRVALMSDNISWLKHPPPFRLGRMQKQWGSCSPLGIINLSTDLIKAPRDCVDYVIAHELCHLKEHNHSKKYYALLDACNPNWRHTKIKLDAMAELILAD